MQLRPTDLPDPVVPATSRCGIGARSAITGSPAMFLPRISGSDMFWSSNAWLPISSDSETISRLGLGSSIPITLRPGMVATRADSADMLRAMSSASWITRLALIPLAGSSSYIVTTGPGRTSTISPRTWKSSSTDSSSRALRSSAARSICWRPSLGGGARDRASGSGKLSPSARLGWAPPTCGPCRATARATWRARRPRRSGAASAERRESRALREARSRAARRAARAADGGRSRRSHPSSTVRPSAK